MGSEGANVCPTCMATYPGTATTCADDGTALVPASTFAHVDKDLADGTVVGEYRVEGKLGEGGFGIVFRGVHPVIGKTVAIKVLSRQCSSNPQMVSRFIAEARAVNQIRHRNIIDIFSFGQLPDGRQYYVMELLDGMPFDKYLARHKRLSFRQALPIFRGVARALDAAHGKDILHRDLKPENVYLVFDEDGGVLAKLLDFGLVKLLTQSSGSHKTKTGTPMGTPYYMSPEQCHGHEVDRRTDVYSFGVMVYEVLTGSLPFTGDSAMDILLKHITATPAPPSSLCGELSPALDAAILKMLAKAAKDRPATLGEALELLVQAANTGGVVAPDSGAVLPPPGPVSDSYQAAATIPAITATMPGGIAAGAVGSVKVITNPVPSTTPSAQVAQAEAVSAKGSTFLGAEPDVAEPKPTRSRAFAGIAMAGLALAVGAAIVFTMKQEKPVTPNGPNVASPPMVSVVASSATAAASSTASAIASAPAAVAPTEIALTIENAPPGAMLSLDGAPPTPVAGPLKVKAGAESKLTITAKGFKPKDVKVAAATTDQKIDATLEKAPAGKGNGNAPAGGKPGAIDKDLMGFDQNK